jgi:membrane protease YdiL (CAAX protease family)
MLLVIFLHECANNAQCSTPILQAMTLAAPLLDPPAPELPRSLPRALLDYYGSAIRRHPVVFAALVAFAMVPVFLDRSRIVGGWATAAYPLTMVACAVVFDVLLLACGQVGESVRVRRPGLEAAWVLGPFALAFVWLTFRFVFPEAFPALAFLVHPPGFALVWVFLAPFVPVAALLWMGYRRSDFGVCSNGVLAAPVLVLLVAGASASVWPGLFRELHTMLRHNGEALPLLLNGIFLAAIPEELYRHLMQTRLGALLRNRALGWLLASFLWGFAHLPANATEAFESWPAFGQGLIEAAAMTPLGLLWGYLTLRSKSVVPALLIHGTNLWQLHNI